MSEERGTGHFTFHSSLITLHGSLNRSGSDRYIRGLLDVDLLPRAAVEAAENVEAEDGAVNRGDNPWPAVAELGDESGHQKSTGDIDAPVENAGDGGGHQRVTGAA